MLGWSLCLVFVIRVPRHCAPSRGKGGNPNAKPAEGAFKSVKESCMCAYDGKFPDCISKAEHECNLDKQAV